MNRIIGLDIGVAEHGMAVIDDGHIVYAANLSFDALWDKITVFASIPNLSIVIEAIAPYLGRLSPETIQTAMNIGEALYRLRSSLRCDVDLMPRSKVKEWAFNNVPGVRELCQVKADKMAAKLAEKRGEEPKQRTATFIYVDDRIMTKAMKQWYAIPDVEGVGKKNIYGLSRHSWQALAVATAYKKSPASGNGQGNYQNLLL